MFPVMADENVPQTSIQGHSRLSGKIKKGALWVLPALAVAIALRNVLPWQLSGVWTTTGSSISNAWAALYHAFGENDFAMYMIPAVFSQISVFIVVNSFFAFLDLTGKPEWLVKYKIQEAKTVPVNWQIYKKTLRRVGFNLTVTTLVFQLTVYPFYLLRGNSCGYELPSIATVIWNLFVCVMVVEIGFFYSHWLFHYPPLYKSVHKTHHEWTAPVGVASIYCHPLEHYFVNLLPVAGGPLIAGAHLSVGLLWFTLVIISTTINHSGYHFPFFPSSEWHDFHHAKFNQCFGVIGLLDYIHNTDNKFRASKAYDRHVVLLGLKPAKLVYPDPKPATPNKERASERIHTTEHRTTIQPRPPLKSVRVGKNNDG